MNVISLILKYWLYAMGAMAVLAFFFFGLYFLFHKSKNAYVVENGKVYFKAGTFPNYGSTEIKNVDIVSFKSLKYPYAKDKNHVYYQGNVMKGCSPQHFQFLDFARRYSRDDQHVYWHRSMISNDPAHFVIFEDALAKDSRQVIRGASVLLGADPNTFEILGNDYYRDKDAVFYSLLKVEGANPLNFTIVAEDQELGRDGDKLFRKGLAIDSGYKRLDRDYTIDGENARYKEEIIPGADPESFEVVYNKMRSYAKDAYRVYFEKKTIENADPKTFEIVGEGYGFAKDAHFAYYNEKKLVGSHGPSFEILDMDRTIARDKNYAYDEKGERIEGLKGEKLRALSDSYATDGEKVVYNGSLVPEADGATFKIVYSVRNHDYGEGEDKNNKYRYGKMVSLFVGEEQ